MANVRTGKAKLEKIWDRILKHEGHNYTHDTYEDEKSVFPDSWDLDEIVSLECIEGKGLVVTRTNGEFHKIETIEAEYYADRILGELFAKQMKVFTDNDLDGYSCGLVATNMFGKLNVDIEYQRYDKLFDKLKEFFSDHDEHKKFYNIYMTDLSITEEQFLELKELADPTFDWDNRFVMIDHHETALKMNKYKFAHVTDVMEDGFRPCGTSLFYEHCLNDSYYKVDRYHRMEDFVEQVRQWDVWDFEKEGNIVPPKLNKLSELYSPQEFIELMIERLDSGKFITDNEEFYLEMKAKEMEGYFKGKEKRLIPIQFEGYNMALVFGEQFRSELGNHLSKTFPEYDAIMLIGMTGGVSLRTIHDHVNCATISKKFNGGGHPKASGFCMNGIKEFIADIIIDKEWE